MKEIKINLNELILVKLTDKGYQHLADNHNEIIRYSGTFDRIEAWHYKNMADENGYTKFQIWSFIESFGDITHMGMDEYYDLNIIYLDYNNNKEK